MYYETFVDLDQIKMSHVIFNRGHRHIEVGVDLDFTYFILNHKELKEYLDYLLIGLKELLAEGLDYCELLIG